MNLTHSHRLLDSQNLSLDLTLGTLERLPRMRSVTRDQYIFRMARGKLGPRPTTYTTEGCYACNQPDMIFCVVWNRYRGRQLQRHTLGSSLKPTPGTKISIHIISFYFIRDRLTEWSLGCVNPSSWLPVATGNEFTQPRACLLADPCTLHIQSLD